MPYTIHELSDEAQEHALEKYRNNEFDWADEYLNSLKALAKHFGGRVRDYRVSWENVTYSNAQFDMPEDAEPEWIKEKLDQLGDFDPVTYHGHGECVLTGYCGDESAIDGFRRAWYEDGERDLNKLMQAAFDSWLEEAQKDCEYQFSEEHFKELCDGNEFWFNEDGSRYLGKTSKVYRTPDEKQKLFDEIKTKAKGRYSKSSPPPVKKRRRLIEID